MADETNHEWSPKKRIMVGDTVALDQGSSGAAHGHEELDHNTEGVVSGFANEERTYLVVEFESGQYTLTEEELRIV